MMQLLFSEKIVVSSSCSLTQRLFWWKSGFEFESSHIRFHLLLSVNGVPHNRASLLSEEQFHAVHEFKEGWCSIFFFWKSGV